MNGILCDVAIDMAEAIIDHYEYCSLQNIGGRDNNLLLKPKIEAKYLSPGSSDENMSEIIVGDLILDDSDDNIMVDNELKIEDLGFEVQN